MNTLPFSSTSPTPPGRLNYRPYTSKQLKVNSHHNSSSSLSTLSQQQLSPRPIIDSAYTHDHPKDSNQRPSSFTSSSIDHQSKLTSNSSPHLTSIRHSLHHPSRSINSINSNNSSPVNSRPSTPAHLNQPNSSSSTSSKFSITPNSQVPFRSGFQPKGVYRNLTDLFISFRKGKEEIKRLEESRLQKRLERLIDLHFPNPFHSNSTSDSNSNSTPLLNSFSSLTNHYLSNLIEPNSSIRSKEQNIVRWQEDSELKRCTICNSQFTVRVRKHHCRLCGKVICFLPPDHPTNHLTSEGLPPRKERCSSFIRFEWDSQELIESRFSNPSNLMNEKSIISNQDNKYPGKIVELTDEEIGINTDDRHTVFDLMNKKSTATFNPTNPNLVSKPKGVRVCRECLTIVLRRQSMTYPMDVPEYLKLYYLLKQLQDKIERSLPEFQEMLINSKNPTSNLNPSKPPPPIQLMNMRKRLLRNLQSYDSTSKRLSQLSSSNQQQTLSEERLKKAIITRSAFFLRDHMGLIRSIGGFDLIDPSSSSSTKPIIPDKPISSRSKTGFTTAKSLSKPSKESLMNSSSSSNPNNPLIVSTETKEFGKLNVLLEQERLVEGYLEEANVRRQLEDAASLKISLDELRDEIKDLKEKLSQHSNLKVNS
ncbi:FYVE zinc finger-domain-containing protein [Melampsora americana]|nr:FYVE zinc finger-domain-containing protein [Melampsora americana]